MKPIGTLLKNACPECKSDMILRNSKYGLFYGCVNYPKCQSTHGAHNTGKLQGEPLGIPADKETKEWRIKAHNVFDKLWKKNGLKRTEAYSLLQMIMGMEPEDAHIGKFNIRQCKKVIKLLEATQ